ncbi:phospholipase A2-like isoform X2 [Planococcus citri]|uniref:phospholipase A2-like isoform X2 n=1 Tax=Planococcus citri TaxID=170843 RepID=UPI0031FA44C7
MQKHVLTTLLIAQLQNTLVISQSKQFAEEMSFVPTTFFQSWQSQVQQSPLNMLSPLLSPLFSQFAAVSKKGTSTAVSSLLTESDTGDNVHVSSPNENTKYLPTIAAPFLDSLAHGIIGGLQHHIQLIKPGTKWCGDGNKARSYEDVGVLYKTDKCCRMHDKCPYYILARESKYGLYNDGHFTRSHCDCDASFYDCLKKVNSPFSTSVGIAYFNILKMRCFRLEYPIVMCSRMAGWISKHCVEYVVDMAKQKDWQWFDNHEFR